MTLSGQANLSEIRRKNKFTIEQAIALPAYILINP